VNIVQEYKSGDYTYSHININLTYSVSANGDRLATIKYEFTDKFWQQESYLKNSLLEILHTLKSIIDELSGTSHDIYKTWYIETEDYKITKNIYKNGHVNIIIISSNQQLESVSLSIANNVLKILQIRLNMTYLTTGLEDFLSLSNIDVIKEFIKALMICLI
jgi:hypothetical protein